MKIQENQYIYPPRAKECTPRKETQIYKDLGWLAQFKYNDTRCLIKLKEDGRVELWGRHAERLKYTPSVDLQDQLQEIRNQLPGYCLLDGGLLHSKHPAIKHTIVIWDILVKDSEHLISTTYKNRYQSLILDLVFKSDNCKSKDLQNYSHEGFTLGMKFTDDIFIPYNIQPNEWEMAWDMVDNINTLYPNNGPLIEGLVFKDLEGELEYGFNEKNNSTWMSRSRVPTGRHAF